MHTLLEPELAERFTQCWQMLGRGSVDVKDPFHTPTLLSLDEDGYPVGRSVILRRVFSDRRELRCHSDLRAGKIQQLTVNPKMSWHLWHPRRRIQLRLWGQTTLHQTGDVAEEEWNRLDKSSKLNYSAQQSPGSAVPSLASAQAVYTRYEALDQADTEAWRSHFTVLVTLIHKIDYLHLDRAGHQRAQFHWAGSQWQGSWLIP